MQSSERGLERAEEFELKQSELAVGRIRAGLEIEGSPLCDDCGDEIDAARRAALPSAKRCLPCQMKAERKLGLRR